MPETMRAIVVPEVGPADVMRLETVPRPAARMTEVLVRVTAAGINPADWKARASGNLIAPPYTPGWDVAGVVEELGFGVTRFAVGDRVFGMAAFPYEAAAYGEFTSVRSRQLARTPDGIDDVQAAALPLASLTAYQCLVDTAAVGEGTRVLVLNASGGVGHLAVQIAKAQGAHVIGTARAQHHDWLRTLGADELVDYSTTDVGQAVTGADVVLDLVGGRTGRDALPALRDDGLFVNVPSGSDAEALRELAQGRVRITNILVEPDRVGMEAIAALAAEGRLTANVAATFPLVDAARAHAIGEQGETGGGKLVLEV